MYIPVFESDLVHSTKGEVFDRNVDGDYKVTSPERIANIYARKQKVNTEDELFPYAKMSDLRPDLIKRARQMAINNSQNTHIWANMTDEEMLRSLDFLRTNLNELLNDPLDDLLDDTQNKILNLIKDNNSLTYDEISNQLNISSSTVKRTIKEMKELDIIIRVNGKRDGYWKILK